MLVSRRFGDRDVTARLVGHRYVADGAVAGAERSEEDKESPSVGKGPPSPPLERHDYQAYLRSEAWAGRRAAVLGLA
jgi:hypothetical protein